jgi:phosphatidylglycerophosphate synthase
VNKTGKAATAVLMASVAVIMYRSGTSLVGEIMFYSGLGLSLFAGALYLGAVRRQLGDDAPSGGGR